MNSWSTYDRYFLIVANITSRVRRRPGLAFVCLRILKHVMGNWDWTLLSSGDLELDARGNDVIVFTYLAC